VAVEPQPFLQPYRQGEQQQSQQKSSETDKDEKLSSTQKVFHARSTESYPVPTIQGKLKIREPGEGSQDLSSAINSARGRGQSLDAGLQQSMGRAMGADFSEVKIHTDTKSDQINQSIQAKAFTTGSDVFFRQGAYEPGSYKGQELIAHELTHVVQQGGGIETKPTQNTPDVQQKSSGDLEDNVQSSQIEAVQLSSIDGKEASNLDTPGEQNTPQDLNLIALHNHTKQMSSTLISDLLRLKQNFGKAFFQLAAGAVYQYCVVNTIDFPFDKLFPEIERGLNGQSPADWLSWKYPSFSAGRVIGDATALYTAIDEITTGTGMDGGAVAGAPETGGASLALTVPGTTLILHGTYAGVRSLADLYKRLGIVLHIEENHESDNDNRGGKKGKTFRGGGKKQRDNWYGYDKDLGFVRWWHRKGKAEYGGHDIENAQEAKDIYDYWDSIGRPVPK
jgi:hypothetical protein